MSHAIGRSLVALAMGLLIPFASAQESGQGPAGNTHPGAQAITDSDGTNPFAPAEAPDAPAFSTIGQKEAFSKAVDLSPMRDLAVSHGGRVKILDTLARETVSSVTGRQNYLDFDKTSEGGTLKVRKIGYDPMFTYLDMMIDPVYYADKALLHVEFLSLREAFLEVAFEDAQTRERWKKVGRLRPDDVGAHGEQILRQYQLDPPYRKGLDAVFAELELYLNGWKNLLVIPPASESEEWIHLSRAAPESEIAKVTVALADAWRAQDAPTVNAQIVRLAELLPAVNPDVYPTTRRELERIYNASNPFSYGYWIYGLAFVTLLLAFGTRWKALVVGGIGLLFVAIALHTFGFTVRSIIAERYAIQNQFESMTGLSLGAALIGTVLMAIFRQWLFGAAAAAVGFMVLLTASTTGIPGDSIEREAAILNTSVLLKYHVSTVLLSYGLISLGFVVSLFFLATHYLGRGTESGAEAVTVSAEALGLDGETTNIGPQRILSELDTAQMIVLQLAFWTLGVGILLGAWWADHSWGRWWAFDPKELWALITWIVYLIVIHIRFTTKRRALVTAWLSVVGFIVMLWTYFGVNLLLPGLHAYA